MKTQIVESLGSPKVSRSSVDATLSEFFARTSLVQRIQPVLHELVRMVVAPGASVENGTLPSYCQNIIRILRKTYFKALPADGLERCESLDWECLGQIIGVGMNCLQFGRKQLQHVLEAQGLDSLSKAEMTNLVRMVFPIVATEGGQSELWPSMPDATVQDMVAGHFSATASELWQGFAVCNQGACQFGPEAMTAFSAGLAKGMGSFVDETGQFVGETERANIYWFLLIAWPEIQAMQNARPAKTRNDFDEWLRPFVNCGLVSISSFSQLLDVCDDIGLNFKGRGAPRKKQLPVK